jgi:hypothetical protein
MVFEFTEPAIPPEVYRDFRQSLLANSGTLHARCYPCPQFIIRMYSIDKEANKKQVFALKRCGRLS